MDFANFGLVSYTKLAKVSAFVDSLAEGKFKTTKCKQCGTMFFPPQTDCPHCLTSDVEWVEVPDKGKLLSFTTAFYGPAGFDKQVPYTLGIVEFTGGIKVLAPVSKAIDPKTLAVGMKLGVRAVKLNAERFAYEFA